MYILSKYKDYYDYLTGIYGVDPKLILDRREGFIHEIGKYEYQSKESYKINLIICGRRIEGYRYQNKIYYGQDLIQFKNKENSKSIFRKVNYPHITIEKEKFRGKYEVQLALEPIEGFDIINKQYNCPILIEKGLNNYEKFPKLEELNLASFIPAEQLYQWLSQWLAHQIDEQQNIKSNLTNIEKIENKGFDKIKSFRNIKV